MSTAFRPRGLRAIRRSLDEWVLRRYYWRQALVRDENSVDRAGLDANLDLYQELPPLLVNGRDNWGGSWNDSYAMSASPLVDEADERVSLLKRVGLSSSDKKVLERELEYGYICLVKLRP
jgi:hypothetical protein